jgi:hypothetical protein
MATVRISVSTGSGDYEVTHDMPETNGEAWGSDKTHIDALLDHSVREIKRAYTGESEARND